jgi:hypothetical protein
MRAIQFGSGTDLQKVANHIHVTLRNLAQLETGLAREILRRQEVHLDAHLEQGRQAKSAMDAFDLEIAAAQAEVDQKTQLVKDAEAQLKSKKPSVDRDAINQAWQVCADAADHVEVLKQRKLTAQSKLEWLDAQRPSIDASLTALRTELGRIEEFYSVLERKAQ